MWVCLVGRDGGALERRIKRPLESCRQHRTRWNPPFHLIIGAWGEGRAPHNFSHLLPTEAEVVNRPHVRKLHDFYLLIKIKNKKTQRGIDDSHSQLRTVLFPFTPSLSPVYNTSSPPQVLMSFPLGEGVWEPVTWPAFTLPRPWFSSLLGLHTQKSRHNCSQNRSVSQYDFPIRELVTITRHLTGYNHKAALSNVYK